MSDRETTLSTFPASRTEALTMLYLQSKDLSKFTPREIVDEYQIAYLEIKDELSKTRTLKDKEALISKL